MKLSEVIALLMLIFTVMTFPVFLIGTIVAIVLAIIN